jgi:RHS repeat-associated protein
VQTGDGPEVTQHCGSSVCQDPSLPKPTFTFTDGCSPFFGTCAGAAVAAVEFPGNHNNGFDQFYSWAALELRRANGTLIGDCGHPFATITHDFGTVTVTGSANCTTPGVSTADLVAIACKNMGSCQKTVVQHLDFDFEGGCVIPPMQQCGTGDASCMECLPGGVGVGGGGSGAGGPGSPETGPNATLRYASSGAGRTGLPGSVAWAVTLGRYWSHDYAERIVPLPDETKVWLITKWGTYREWSSLNGTTGLYGAVAPSSEKRELQWLGAGLGWKLTGLDRTVDLYDEAGRWLSRTDRNGNAKVATYSGGLLSSVSFPDDRREDLGYNPSTGKLATIDEVGVDGTTTSTWSYTWTGDDLTRIGRPDGTALLFAYDTGGAMTRMAIEGTDNTSVRVLRRWEHDTEGNVTGTWAGDEMPTGPDAVDVWSLRFDDPAEPTVTTVTDPLGQEITYQLGRDTVSNNVKVLQVDGDCPVCGVGPNAQLSYDDTSNPLLPTAIVDGRGTTTSFTYDPGSGQTLTRTEADGDLAYQRMTSWTYDGTFPALVTSLMQPSVAGGSSLRMTDFMRDSSGNVTDRILSGVEAGSAFSYVTTTSYSAAGQPLTIDPDGHGADDQTSFTYDPARGNLLPLTRTDPIVGVTSFGYDPFNRRTSITGPNGVTMRTAYDALDRVTEVRQEGASPPTDDLVTTHAYTVFGDLFRTTLPAGNVIEYGYDAAGRLISVERKTDAGTHGERVLYTLDAAGNRTLEQLQRWDATASAWVTFSSTEYEYTNRCRVGRIVQAPGSPEAAVTAFEHDCNGNLSAQWDANHDPATDPPTTSYTHDALDRILTVSQPWAGGGAAVTSYSYDVQDHLVGVTDAEGNTTSYAYSDRDLLTQEVSPASGTTTHAHDEHGELVTTTDARGITVTRTVDALDRATFVDYPDDTLDTLYSYDAAPASCSGTSFPAGRLGAITRNGEAVEYCYDRFGRTTKDGELVYTWDANGNRTGIGYPGGVSATYGFDFADREVSLSVTSPGGTEPVVSAASYLPSGPLASLALGSGVTETRAFDGRYAPTAIALTGPVEKTFTYTTDRVGNILEITEQAGCTPGPIVLESQTVTTEELFVSCTTIEAGNNFAVESPGDVTFHAQGTIALKSGFSVGSGARFVAGSGALPELSRRTYTYQAPQYFLTGADGPWGTLDWSYDKIGNRLAETRNGATDSYQYQLNAGSGNTPILDLINLAVTGTRDYTWGPAGHLEEVAAGANVLDFGADAEGRLSGVDRTAASEAAGFSYDGRSFLQTAQETAGGTRSVDPLYDSAGLAHALLRRPSPTDPAELIVFVYLAGRPVAQLAIDGSGAESWTYLSTDHLGTPLLATADTGTVVWEGGFEPFGRDYQQGTIAGASERGLFLRLPGQWDDGTWDEAASGAEVYHNVHRFLAPGIGRYTRPDPIRQVAELYAGPTLYLLPGSPYLYVAANPVRFIDPRGLTLEQALCTLKYTVVGLVAGGLAGSAGGCAVGAGVGVFAGGVGALPGCGAGAVTGGIVGAALGAGAGAIVGTTQCSCPPPDEVDCGQAKQICIEKCTEETLPTGTLDGAPFFKCLRECLDSFGC